MNLSKHLTAKAAASLLVAAAMITPVLAVPGTVDASGGLRLRNGVGTTAAILETLPNGAEVDVTAITEEGWCQVTYHDTVGYVSGEYLVMDEADKQSLDVIGAPVYVKVVQGPLNVRSLPSTDGDRIKQLSVGAVVQTVEEVDGWYKIDGGYICAGYVEIVDPSEAVVSSGNSQVVEFAKQYLGYPYVYGGSSPKGFDCSGFVKYIYSQFGVSLNRTASAQMGNGASVSRDELQPGDLVFFLQSSASRASHVGIYIGNNQFIHASSPSTGVIISDMDSHTGRGYVGARRVL